VCTDTKHSLVIHPVNYYMLYTWIYWFMEECIDGNDDDDVAVRANHNYSLQVGYV